MTVVHVKKRENPFVQIDKSIFENEKISWKAKGILGYLLSKPKDWKTYVADLEKRSTDGRDSTRKGIQELIEHGYILRTEVREKGRFKGYDYTVLEEPMVITEDGKTEDGKTEDGKTEIGKTEIGKSHTTNNDLSNNDLSDNESTNNNIVQQAELCIPFEEIINYLNEQAGTKFRHATKTNQSFIKARWNEGFNSIEDYKTVIDNKVADWINTEHDKYLRPSTLFGTKFESYLNQKTKKKKKRVNDPNDFGAEALEQNFNNENKWGF